MRGRGRRRDAGLRGRGAGLSGLVTASHLSRSALYTGQRPWSPACPSSLESAGGLLQPLLLLPRTGRAGRSQRHQRRPGPLLFEAVPGGGGARPRRAPPCPPRATLSLLAPFGGNLLSLWQHPVRGVLCLLVRHSRASALLQQPLLTLLPIVLLAPSLTPPAGCRHCPGRFPSAPGRRLGGAWARRGGQQWAGGPWR